jgi:adenylate cyclase
LERRLAAILAADVVGYSTLMAEDEEATLAQLKAHRANLFDPKIAEHNGRIIKLMGDGTLVEFASIVDAVNCAIAIQTVVAETEDTIRLRIGINLGDVIVDGDDIYGDGVNIAARLEALATPQGVCISDLVFQSIRSKIDAAFVDFGEQELKNINVPVRIWQWSQHAIDSPSTTVSKSLELRDKPSIAVLPFDNMSGEPEQVYFSDGISEDIITDLSKIKSLFVAARNSTFAYRGKSIDLRKVSRALNVQYILEGSVRRAGDKVRITAQLIDGKTGGHIWADRYDRDLQDIFAIQDEITGEIVSALSQALEIGPAKNNEPVTQVNAKAYDYALRGRYLTYQFTREASNEATALFNKAIKIDSTFGMAYWGLSINLNTAVTNGWIGEENYESARNAAQTAVRLAPTDVKARRALALSLLWQKELDMALAEMNEAISISPSTPELYATRGYILSYLGHPEMAVTNINTAIELDSHYPDIWLHFLGHALYLSRNFEAAVDQLESRIRRQPQTDISRALLAACFGQLGRQNQAQAVWHELKQINPDYSLEEKQRILPYRRPQDWDLIIEGIQKASIEK